MKRLAALPLLLAGCAVPAMPGPNPAPAVQPAEAPLQSAANTIRSWGRLVHRWTLDGDGRVEFVRSVEPFAKGPGGAVEIRRLTLDAGQRAALTEALTRVGARHLMPAGCEQQITDAYYGALSWTRFDVPMTIKWDANCTAGRDAALTEAIFEADKIVKTAAMATGPLETRPSDD